jgi:hypothetical protein
MTREKQLAKLANRADEQAVLAKRKRKFHELQDGYRFISYEIGENHLIIRVLTLLWHFRLPAICKEHVAVRTSPGWRSCEDVEDRLPDSRHTWLWWRS